VSADEEIWTGGDGLRIVSVVGNPRPDSRTHGLARALTTALSVQLHSNATAEVDLTRLCPGLLDASDPLVAAAVQEVLGADILIVASPTYKATYSGLLKVFLDRLGTGTLSGTRAVPVMLGGAPNHQLAVDLHLTPLLLELGASVPVRGLFVLETELEAFAAHADAWARAHARVLSVG
jgi:FMN reductase